MFRWILESLAYLFGLDEAICPQCRMSRPHYTFDKVFGVCSWCMVDYFGSELALRRRERLQRKSRAILKETRKDSNDVRAR